MKCYIVQFGRSPAREVFSTLEKAVSFVKEIGKDALVTKCEIDNPIQSDKCPDHWHLDKEDGPIIWPSAKEIKQER